MKFTTRDLQARIAALGYHPGPIDGVDGRRTQAAAKEAMRARGVTRHSKLFDPSGLHRVHLHWTAGAYGVIGMERRAYNGIVDQDGSRIMGEWPFLAQASYVAGQHGASHTLSSNTGCIGLSIDAMAGAKETPFDQGKAPLTWLQVDAICAWAAELSLEFDIPVSRYSILSHAEVQPTLGIRQKFKWDICWLPDMDKPGDPVAVGDRLRSIIAEKRERMTAMAA